MLAILASFSGLLLPAVQRARESARPMQCGVNLKQVALAFHSYEPTRSLLPPLKRPSNCTAAPNGEFRMAQRSWAANVLPYLEEAGLLQTYEFQWDWWVTANGVARTHPCRQHWH